MNTVNFVPTVEVFERRNLLSTLSIRGAPAADVGRAGRLDQFAVATDQIIAATTVTLSNGYLTFDSAGANSIVSVRQADTSTIIAVVDGQEYTFASADVRIVGFIADGNDLFVNDTNRSTVAKVRGVNNTIVTGTSASMIYDFSRTATIVSRNPSGGMRLDFGDVILYI